MNKKSLIFSTLSLGLLISALSGCDWCSCCKKDSCSATKASQTTVDPKMMVQHPEEHETPMTEPIPKIAIPAPVAPMPEEPKTI
jgi:hypothetical protein